MNQNAIEDYDSEGFLENVDEGISTPFPFCRMIETKDSAINRVVRKVPVK